MVVLLGTPTPASSELYAITVIQGDPSWAGALGGVALNLPLYHVLEPQVKALVSEDVYEEQIGFALFSLDSEALESAVRQVREGRA